MEDWFRITSGIEVDDKTTLKLQAFADDQLVMIRSTSVKRIEAIWSKVECRCIEWATRNNLDYAEHKTVAMFSPGSKVIREPVIKMKNERINITGSLNYLGIIIDSKLLFIEHIRHVRAKVAPVGNRVRAVAGKTWGSSPEILATIYNTVIKPMLLYGAEIWGSRGNDSRIRKHLAAAQRPFLLAISKAYRTTSNCALQVITGCPPLHLVGNSLHESWNRRQETDFDASVPPALKPPPDKRETTIQFSLQSSQLPEDQDNRTWIFVDAAKSDEGLESYNVGAIAYRNQVEAGVIRAEIVGPCATHLAELCGIKWVLQTLLESDTRGEINIASDSIVALNILTQNSFSSLVPFQCWQLIEQLKSRSSTVKLWHANRANVHIQAAETIAKGSTPGDRPLASKSIRAPLTAKVLRSQMRSELIAKWQIEWDAAKEGRLTHEYIPKPSYKLWPLRHQATQLVTGHGNFKQYLKRFNLKQTDGLCACAESEQSAKHLAWECSIEEIAEKREVFKTLQLKAQGSFPMTFDSKTTVAMIEDFNNFATAIVPKDDV